MPLPDAPDYSKRIYELLKETDLENLSYAQFQGVAEKLFIEPENEDEMRRLVLVQLARMAVRGDWDGFLSGSAGTIGGSTTEDLIAFGAASADTITKDSGFSMVVKGDGATTVVKVGSINVGAQYVSANTTNGSLTVRCDGSGQIFLNSGSDYGGTYTDTIVNVMKNTLSDTNQVKFRDTVNGENATLTEIAGELNVKSNVDAKDITLETKTTGVIRIKNQTTNTDTQLNVQGNGTGTPKINLSNDTKAVTIQCDENQKLKIDGGGGNTFVIDVSTATSGITFADGTTQVTAAGGGGGGSGLGVVLTPAGLGSSVSSYANYTISNQLPYVTSDFNGAAQNFWVNNPRYWAFIAPADGDISQIKFRVGTGQSGANMLIGIYSDAGGYPGAQIAAGSADVSSSGYKTISSITGSVTVEANKQYWFGQVLDTTRTVFVGWGHDNETCSKMFPIAPPGNDNTFIALAGNTTNSLPSSAPTITGATGEARMYSMIQIT